MSYIDQFSQPLNLFLSKSYSINMGYLSPKKVLSIRSGINEVLVLMQASSVGLDLHWRGT